MNRLFCGHKWTEIATATIGNKTVDYYYGCVKCAKVKKMSSDEHIGWQFQQRHKGAIIDE